MNRFYSKPEKCDPNLVWFDHGKLCIRPEEIVYLSSLENYTEFHLKCGKKVISSRTLKIHEEDLVKKGNFERVHRKYMLNMNYLQTIECIGTEKIAKLTTGDSITVSRRQAKRLL